MIGDESSELPPDDVPGSGSTRTSFRALAGYRLGNRHELKFGSICAWLFTRCHTTSHTGRLPFVLDIDLVSKTSQYAIWSDVPDS